MTTSKFRTSQRSFGCTNLGVLLSRGKVASSSQPSSTPAFTPRSSYSSWKIESRDATRKGWERETTAQRGKPVFLQQLSDTPMHLSNKITPPFPFIVRLLVPFATAQLKSHVPTVMHELISFQKHNCVPLHDKRRISKSVKDHRDHQIKM